MSETKQKPTGLKWKQMTGKMMLKLPKKLQMDKASLYRRARYVFFGFVALCFAACSNTKYIPAGDALYTGSKVVIKSTGLKKKQKKEIKTELQALTRPKPN